MTSNIRSFAWLSASLFLLPLLVLGCDRCDDDPSVVQDGGLTPDSGGDDAGGDAATDSGVVVCSDDTACDEDAFCALGEACAAPGSCAPRPESCDDEHDPVCGCDEITYASACVAQMSGVSVAHTGPCDDYASCGSADDCEEDEYCYALGCRVSGVCVARPGSCEGEPSEPVCGCDGSTYDNACEAAFAGVIIAAEGACDGGDICTEETDCGDGRFCDRPGCADSGTCKDIPAVCDDVPITLPVCGCDGMTYETECLAAAEGVSVAHPGLCSSVPIGCRTNEQCGRNYFCKKSTCEGQGVCELRPLICVGLPIDPELCACDGMLYATECHANSAGTNVTRDAICIGVPGPGPDR